MIACKIKLKLCFHLGKWLYCSEAVWILTLFSQCRYAVFSETSLNHWVFDSGSGSRALRCRSHGTVRAAVPVRGLMQTRSSFKRFVLWRAAEAQLWNIMFLNWLVLHIESNISMNIESWTVKLRAVKQNSGRNNNTKLYGLPSLVDVAVSV